MATKEAMKLIAEYRKIVAKFDDYSASDPFGWDLATMHIIFPEDATRFREIRRQLREFQGQKV
jgi:hypothetical protein